MLGSNIEHIKKNNTAIVNNITIAVFYCLGTVLLIRCFCCFFSLYVYFVYEERTIDSSGTFR